jgi:hypothetical protein
MHPVIKEPIIENGALRLCSVQASKVSSGTGRGGGFGAASFQSPQ